MRILIRIALTMVLLLGFGFAQGNSPADESVRGVVSTEGTNGKPAVLPGVRIVLHGPITTEAGSDAQGAFAIDGLPPGTYQIEANASRLCAALAREVGAGTSSTVPNEIVEMNVAAVTSTKAPQLTQLKAMDSAFSRKVHHA